MLRTAAICALLATLATAPGCLWLPGLFPEKGTPANPPVDDRIVSHCWPHSGRMLLLGTQTDERTIQCRVAQPAQADWTLSFLDPPSNTLSAPAVSDYRLAVGVDSIVLSRDDLPWSPHPYEAVLTLRPAQGQTFSWRLIVLPHADDAWPLPEDTGEEDQG